jgi:hypothetical protein
MGVCRLGAIKSAPPLDHLLVPPSQELAVCENVCFFNNWKDDIILPAAYEL